MREKDSLPCRDLREWRVEEEEEVGCSISASVIYASGQKKAEFERALLGEKEVYQRNLTLMSLENKVDIHFVYLDMIQLNLYDQGV